MFVYVLLQVFLALWSSAQLYLVAKFLLTTNEAPARAIFSMMMVSTAAILVLPLTGLVAKWLVVAMATMVCVVVAALTRNHVQKFALLENVANQTINRETGERVPFAGSEARYFPNIVIVLLLAVNYLSLRNHINETISLLGFIAVLPIFAIKLVGERRF